MVINFTDMSGSLLQNVRWRPASPSGDNGGKGQFYCLSRTHSSKQTHHEHQDDQRNRTKEEYFNIGLLLSFPS